MKPPRTIFSSKIISSFLPFPASSSSASSRSSLHVHLFLFFLLLVSGTFLPQQYFPSIRAVQCDDELSAFVRSIVVTQLLDAECLFQVSEQYTIIIQAPQTLLETNSTIITIPVLGTQPMLAARNISIHNSGVNGTRFELTQVFTSGNTSIIRAAPYFEITSFNIDEMRFFYNYSGANAMAVLELTQTNPMKSDIVIDRELTLRFTILYDAYYQVNDYVNLFRGLTWSSYFTSYLVR